MGEYMSVEGAFAVTQQPSDLSSLVYPLFAPLPIPMILHLLRGPSKAHPAATQQPLTWQELEQQVSAARHAVYTIMYPFVEGDSLSTAWLLQTLTANSPNKSPVQGATLALWHERKLMRYTEQRRGRPDPENAAALLVTRMVDRRERNWLPTTMAEEEPAWWCYRQDSPLAPITACPVPLPSDLPATTLLWTPWRGAGWLRNRPWLPIGNLGAIRWGSAREIVRGSEWMWDLSPHQLREWDSEIAALPFPTRHSARRGNVEQAIHHQQAQLALYRLALAHERLGMYNDGRPDFRALGLSDDQV
jgi:hypothetical protein